MSTFDESRSSDLGTLIEEAFIDQPKVFPNQKLPDESTPKLAIAPSHTSENGEGVAQPLIEERRPTLYIDKMRKFLAEKKERHIERWHQKQQQMTLEKEKPTSFDAARKTTVTEQKRTEEFRARVNEARTFSELRQILSELSQEYPMWEYGTADFLPDNERITFQSLQLTVDTFRETILYERLNNHLPSLSKPPLRESLPMPDFLFQVLERIYKDIWLSWSELEGLMKHPLAPIEVITLLEKLDEKEVALKSDGVTYTAEQLITRLKNIDKIETLEGLAEVPTVLPSLFNLDAVMYCFLYMRNRPFKNEEEPTLPPIKEIEKVIKSEPELMLPNLPEKLRIRFSKGKEFTEYVRLIKQLKIDFAKNG